MSSVCLRIKEVHSIAWEVFPPRTLCLNPSKSLAPNTSLQEKQDGGTPRGYTVNKTQEGGNAAGPRTHFFQQEQKEGGREPKDSRRRKRHINQMIVSKLSGFQFENNFFEIFGEVWTLTF